jgi:flagellar motor switch protein FliG
MADGNRKRFERPEDLAALTDGQIRKLLTEIDQADAVVGFLEMSRELRNRFFEVMSPRARQLIKEDWADMKAPSPEAVLAARTKILRIGIQIVNLK